MRVVATITSSIQSTFPPTAYYKLIDIWLLFTLNIIIMVMMGHTILAWRMKKEEEDTVVVPLPAFYSEPIEILKALRPESSVSRTSGYRSDRDDRNFPVTQRWNKIFKLFIFCFVSIFIVIYWSVAFTAWITVETL